ncbi:hypothetical protein MAPG_05544 [Magnaporthiopsis poae ATCC 64411]|uniref:Uncharacterized protein n=1 Tax=Magnaporthiopsis poae (strain ATCC 64411 / 73-15) TaxID=644358 RepID=A0A0C4DZN8_MAGP6|nr:hypothetical protein MAPG_05544 [Magnaporthiopsis poae ATCC 64411]
MFQIAGRDTARVGATSNFSFPQNAYSPPATQTASFLQRPASPLPPPSPVHKSRPSTSDPTESSGQTDQHKHARDRRPSFSLSRRPSFARLRRGSTSNGSGGDGAGGGGRNGFFVVTDHSTPPSLPDNAALAAHTTTQRDPGPSPPLSADSFSRMLTRTAPSSANGYAPSQLAPSLSGTTVQGESSLVHQHIHDMANKRISTLDYLRKAHEGRVYWFNTLLFDKPDLARLPYFDSRKLARRATNYLLLGLSLPAVIDLNSSTPFEFLRSLNILLGEFETFQNLHSENGTSGASSLSRARIPNMFRRGNQGAKARRTSGANDIGYAYETSSESNSAPTGVFGGGGGPGVESGGGSGGEGAEGGNTSVLAFAAHDTDLLPGEEYTHLLTPSLPFDPDFFETFATLCDVLIDCYTRLLSLLPSPRECNQSIAELFSKADARIRKIIIQGVVKEFEDSSRSGVKNEVANVGKVVLGGLM